MKKIALLGMMLLAFSASLVAAEMTADELIAKHMAAIGGETNVRAIKSMTMKGSMMAQNMTLSAKIMNVLPDKAYMEISMNNSVVQAGGTNGKDAWVGGPMGTYILSGDQKKSAMKQADLFPLLDYKKRGAKVKYLGEDLVKGAKAHKLQYAFEGDTTTFFLDAATFYIVKQKSAEAATGLTDYRKVGNLFLPYKITIQSGQGPMMMSIDTIAVNPTIPDSLFVVPKDAKPMPDMSKQGAPADTTGGKK